MTLSIETAVSPGPMQAAAPDPEVPPADHASTTPSDETGSDDGFYADQDDARSFIQPAISPIATRLSSPKTPAAEKAAAMDRLPGGGLFPVADEAEPPGQSIQRLSQGQQADFRSTALAQVADPQPQQQKSSLSGVFGPRARHQRSYSIGENALRRLSKAFPSLSLPGSFLTHLSSSSIFSSGHASKEALAVEDKKWPPSSPSSAAVAKPDADLRSGRSGATDSGAIITAHRPQRLGLPRPPSVSPRPPLTLHRSTSEDSILDHSLTRVSSYGDDERFANVREQVNVRLKAIMDSWDGPSFKLPQMPNILPAQLRKGQLVSDDSPGLPASASLRGSQKAKAGRDASALDAVLESLTGDIVIMGGYRGSILRSAQPPRRQLWVPVKVGLNMRKVNLEVGLEPEDEENMEERIFPSGMLQHIGPVDISRRLFKKLRECENARQGKLRVHDYGYDWRLSPHLLSRKLIQFLEKLPSNQSDIPRERRGALVIAHSMGGLITRHAVNQRPELFSGVLFAGTPQRCVNILGPLRNGDAVLLNEKVLTAQVNFSMRTSFVLLPEDGFCFIDKLTQEPYPVDFYDVEDWIRYRWSPCVSDPPLPPLMSKSNTFGSLRNMSSTFSSLPLRGRTNSEPKKGSLPSRFSFPPARGEATKDRTLAPQMDASSSEPYARQTGDDDAGSSAPAMTSPSSRARNIAYLRRTLREIKQFRAELAHRAEHQRANAYPPLAVVYGKDTPTVWAARVAGREAIARADAYDDLVFRSGDGVVLAREAMLPSGYELARGGRVSTDRGHVSMLGDLAAVGRALEALVRARKKGVGLGVDVRSGGSGKVREDIPAGEVTGR